MKLTYTSVFSHLRIAAAVTLTSAAAAMAFVAVETSTSTNHATSTSQAKISMSAFRARHSDVFETSLGATRSGEPDPSTKDPDVSKKISKIHNGRAQELYDDQAYPREFIESAQQIAAANAAKQIASLAPLLPVSWTPLGPNGVAADDLVASEANSSVGTIYSGRTTAIAVSPSCTTTSCTLFLAAAGGGVWKTTNALAATPTWSQVSDGASGIPSNAIGSIVFDPTDATHNTIYVGTGEPNGSTDSEAGVGLFKSTDGGSTWAVVSGTDPSNGSAATAPCGDGSGNHCPVAAGRSIGAIAVDPNPATHGNHIFIGTDVARHGASSVIGGRFTPPGSAKVGLYESTNGGATFSPVVILAQDTVNPASANGGDFFRGGCSHIELYRPASETQVYASFFDFGIFRRSMTQDGDNDFHNIFQSAGQSSNGACAQFTGLSCSATYRTEFSLAPNGTNLRVYVGDGGLGETPQNGVVTGIEAQLYRVDNANVAAGTLFTGGTNGGWTQLSSSTNGTPGFGSFNYCTGQCSYDMPVYSPPNSPNIVYIGGASQYGELGGRSNGRDVVRSQDAGANFTDMTADATGANHQPGVALHPDQHALATAPGLPNTLFVANDGGLWRVNGDTAGFFDMSGQCASRASAGTITTANDLIDCQAWLKKVPATITSMNSGLETLQYQSLSVSTHTANDIMGGTQDNGTHASNPTAPPGTFANSWFVSIFGDGGQSGVNNAGNPEVRMHTFFNAPGLTQIDVNFRFNSSPFLFGFPGNETGWNWIGDPGSLSGENVSFYLPLIADPKKDGTWFFGAQHVWRTQDNGGNQTFLETNCSEFVNGLQFTGACGDWVPLGKDLSGTSFGKDKAPGQFIAAISRAPTDNSTLWVGLRRGRVFVSSNADKPGGQVVFFRIDTSSTPTRFVSGIAVDPADPNHAFISYSGYNAYNPTQQGHVFDVHYNPSGHTATFTNIDGGNPPGGLGDQPITGIAYDSSTGHLFVSTDFGVLVRNGSTWVPAASGLPPVATYGLTFDSVHRVLYAATHGRSAYSLSVPLPP